MPLYEYYCSGCTLTFEKLRPVTEADSVVACPSCEQLSSQRILSLFATSVKTNGAAMVADRPTAGGCCGGACGCHR